MRQDYALAIYPVNFTENQADSTAVHRKSRKIHPGLQIVAVPESDKGLIASPIIKMFKTFHSV